MSKITITLDDVQPASDSHVPVCLSVRTERAPDHQSSPKPETPAEQALEAMLLAFGDATRLAAARSGRCAVADACVATDAEAPRSTLKTSKGKAHA